MPARRARRWVSAAITGVAALMATQGVTANPAMAAPFQDEIVTDVASTLTPRVPGKLCYPGVPDPTACRQVLKMIRIGDWIYAAGVIDTVSDGSGTTVTSGFSNLFRFNAITHALDTAFKPQFFRTVGVVHDAGVSGLAASADGSSLYVAGRFTKVASAPGGTALTRRGLAMISTSSGAVSSAFNAKICAGGGPCVAYDVQLVANRSLWVGGNFTMVNKVSRKALASLDPATGALNNEVQLSVDGAPVTITTTKVTRIAANPASTRAVILGNFGSVAGQTRQEVAVLDIDPATGSASVNSWNAPNHLPASVSGCSTKLIWPKDVDWDPTGSFFNIVATGGGGFEPWPALCDAYSRWRDNGDANSIPVVYNQTEVDSIFSVCDVGPRVYVGGHFKSLNHRIRIDGVQVKPPTGTVNERHYGLGVINTSTGLAVTAWNNSIETGRGAGWGGVLCEPGSAATGGGVYFGGDATGVNGNPEIERLAYFPAP